MRTEHIVALGLCMGLAFVQPATGQTSYSCKSPQGTPYRSAVPCPSPKQPPFIYYGPAQRPSTGNSNYIPRTEKPAEELAFMSPRCASMLEGIRTSSVRGVNAQTQTELRQEFDLVCRDDRNRARKAFQLQKEERNRQVQQTQQQEESQKIASQQDQQRLLNQCAEMRRAIYRRKNQPNQSEGERQDLEMFEERFYQRCAQKPAVP